MTFRNVSDMLSRMHVNSIGIERLMSDLVSQSGEVRYPPFNLEKVDDDHYSIVFALAGFRADELEIETKNGYLFVKGSSKGDDVTKNYIHQGIGKRNFNHRFILADYMTVVNANFSDGLLTIDLVRELPEALRGKTININTPNKPEISTHRAGDISG